MDAAEIAKTSSNSLVFIWKYFLYNYFNGWFILVCSIVVLYFVVLRQRYINETAIVDENQKKENFDSSIPVSVEPEPTQEKIELRTISTEIDTDIAENVRMRIDLAIAESTSKIYDMIIQYINALDYSQSNNRKVDLTARKDELIPKIRNILEQEADVLYAELPHQEGKELSKYRIQDMLEKYVAKRMYLNLKAEKEELERKIKEYNGLRDQLVNYGSDLNIEREDQFQTTAQEMKSLRRELDYKNQIFKILSITNLFNNKNSKQKASDTEIAGLYIEISKVIEKFLDSSSAIASETAITTQPNTYKYDSNTRFDGFYLDDIKQRERDATAKYGKAYQDYLAAKEAEDLKVDPVELLSRVENNVIRLLETIKDDNPHRVDEIKNNNADSINPVNFQTDTVGKYLLDKKTQATLIEAFGDATTTTQSTPTTTMASLSKNNKKRNNNASSTSSRKKDIITSLINYIYELLDWGYSKIAGDSYISVQIDKITTDNNQMMTVGFLFVLGSIVLLMIEFTS